MEKPIEVDWVNLKVEWEQSLRESPGGMNGVSQVNGDSGIVPT